MAVDPGLSPEAGPDDAALAAILREVRARTGTDFAGYRASTVRRRVMNRVISAGAATLEGYLSRLRADPAEAGELLQRLTIKVSRFYRNPALVPPVVAALADRAACVRGRPLRAWSAGCGHGEEAYTLAILLAELREPAPDVVVVGTDLDPAALRAAAAARYAPEALVDLPAPLRDRVNAGPRRDLPGPPIGWPKNITRLLCCQLHRTPTKNISQGILLMPPNASR